MMKKLFASITGLALVLGAVVLFNFMSTNSEAASLPRDCDNNSIIRCGATTPTELKDFYKANKTGDLPAVYSHFGISASMINSVTESNLGAINKDGTIVLNGKTVATGAYSIGRQNIYHPSTVMMINNNPYYRHIPLNTFGVNTIRAWVFTDAQGKFLAAILTSCANPFGATPIPTPPTPPTPPPVPTPTYKCDSLTASQPINRTEFNFTGSASAANGATVASYNYNFGDGTAVSAVGTTANHTYTNPGTYTATLTANISVGGKTVQTAATPSCTVAVTVAPAPVASCTALDVRVLKIEDNSYTYALSYEAKNGATLTTAHFDFGDQTSKNYTAAELANVTHAYATAGTYKITATLAFAGVSSVQNPSCSANITIAPEMCSILPSVPKNSPLCTPCTVIPDKTNIPASSPECVVPPVTPPVTPLLPHTGPSDVIVGGLGLGSMIAAGFYWYSSRRDLLSAMLNR